MDAQAGIVTAIIQRRTRTSCPVEMKSSELNEMLSERFNRPPYFKLEKNSSIWSRLSKIFEKDAIFSLSDVRAEFPCIQDPPENDGYKKDIFLANFKDERRKAENFLLVRSEYHRAYESIERSLRSGMRSVYNVITSQPGIGKSTFHYFVIWKQV